MEKNMSPEHHRLSLPTATIKLPLPDSPLLYIHIYMSTAIYYTNEDEEILTTILLLKDEPA
jgi:hypothetical protein